MQELTKIINHPHLFALNKIIKILFKLGLLNNQNSKQNFIHILNYPQIETLKQVLTIIYKTELLQDTLTNQFHFQLLIDHPQLNVVLEILHLFRTFKILHIDIILSIYGIKYFEFTHYPLFSIYFILQNHKASEKTRQLGR